MSNILEFDKSKSKASRLVRVIDITSPFFTWEGSVRNERAREDKKYVQVIFTHKGFEFPPLTFSTEQIVENDYV